MAAEVAAFLLEEKLHILLNDEPLVYPRLRLRIKQAVICLRHLSHFFRNRDLLPSQPDDDNLTPHLLNSIYLADDLVDVYRLRRAQSRRKGSSKRFPLFGLRDLKRGIKKFLKDVRDAGFNPTPEEMKDKARAESTVPGEADPDASGSFHRWGRISHLMDEESKAVGQGSDLETLVSQLSCYGESLEEDKELRVLPVVGPRGSGKTMMVRRVYDRADVKNRFDCRAWVCVSREFSFRDVVVSIIEQTSIKRLRDIDHVKDAVLADMLLKTLMEKRFLIVLDDVFDTDAWYALTNPLPDSKNGSRVILTTRETDVAESVDPWAAPLRLHQLSGAERWDLLLKQIGGRGHDLNEVKNEIVSKSWDSPLEAVLLGGTLSNTGKTQLPALIERLPSAENVEGALSDIVRLCFHGLSPRMKVCFLYFGLFPRGLDLPVRRILRLWLSEGFLNPSLEEQKMKLEPEDLANHCFEDLCNRRLVEVTKWKSDGCPKSCRVLGFLHDHFSERSTAAGFFHVHRGEASEFVEFPQRFLVRRLVEYADIKTCSDHYVDQNLRSFVSFNSGIRGTANRDIGMFLRRLVFKRGFTLLKALDLEGVYKPQLPKEVVNLALLQFLGLRSTVLDLIPSFIGDLPCLETLDLKHTNVTILPKAIWKSKSLRHLYLNEVRIEEFLRKPSKGFLTSLLTLRGLYVGDKKAVANGLNRLTGLRKLGLTCHKSALKAVCSWILSLPNVQNLKLRSIDEFGKPWELEFDSLEKLQTLSSLYLLGGVKSSVNLEGLFPMNIRKLTLSMCQLSVDPMAALGQLPHLRILRLLSQSYRGSEMTCVRGGFNQLQVLKLWMLRDLKSWTIEEGAMPNVRKMEIRRCNSLQNIDGLNHLGSLKDLILTNMSKMITDKVKRSVERGVHVKENAWQFSHYQVINSGDGDRGSPEGDVADYVRTEILED
ncbi:hypothetical protein MLD38_029501 [Melastoma candidum]|uniref:Uncharacterized protein n=1 Tax=Melastoma candidum TaxID=119954 RepID=A0ACB9N536_9MYRT|nr:hypothetical protein MLD38_029501 [Melastoma candidum]